MAVVTGRIRDLRDRPCPERDPTMRRRLDGDQMMARDREVARLRRQGVSLRGIAERLGMSLGSVRLAVKRTSRRQ